MPRMFGYAIALSSLLLCAAPHAMAQAVTDCPALPDTASGMQWTVMRAKDITLCRALDQEGREAFAITLSRKSPFRPERELREEEGKVQGEKMWWYRSEIAGKPNVLVRETLVEVGKNQVAHIFIRTTDKDTLGRYQGIVHGLDFSNSSFAQR